MSDERRWRTDERRMTDDRRTTADRRAFGHRWPVICGPWSVVGGPSSVDRVYAIACSRDIACPSVSAATKLASASRARISAITGLYSGCPSTGSESSAAAARPARHNRAATTSWPRALARGRHGAPYPARRVTGAVAVRAARARVRRDSRQARHRDLRNSLGGGPGTAIGGSGPVRPRLPRVSDAFRRGEHATPVLCHFLCHFSWLESLPIPLSHCYNCLTLRGPCSPIPNSHPAVS